MEIDSTSLENGLDVRNEKEREVQKSSKSLTRETRQPEVVFTEMEKSKEWFKTEV